MHCPHTIIGDVLGNAMNLGVTLPVYASICKELGQAFDIPGLSQQDDAITGMTGASLLASHLTWASTHEAGRDEAFNVVNGDVSAGARCGRRWSQSPALSTAACQCKPCRLPSKWPPARQCGAAW